MAEHSDQAGPAGDASPAPLAALTYANIDLHFHAGNERDPDTTLDDYLSFAAMTGRRVLGVTDHFGYFQRPGPARHYTRDLAGFRQFAVAIDQAARRFPELLILHCPELSAADLANGVPDQAVELSQYFLCEPPEMAPNAIQANTAALLAQVEAVAAFRQAVRRPVVLVHPFRSAVNQRLVKQPIAKAVTDLPANPQQGYSEAQLNDFFMFDLRRYAVACRQHDLPVEINGNTDCRIRRINLAAPYHMLIAAYRLLRDCELELVPGSDLHSITTAIGRGGEYVPWTTFEALNLTPCHNPWLQHLLQSSR